MAGLLLAGVGAAIGGSIGGTFLGISAVVIGQSIGAVIGSAIDNYLFAPTIKSSQEGPRLNEANVMTSVEGANIVRGYGRFKVAGNIIWATRLREEVVKETTKQGGKGGGGGSEVTTTTYNYYANFAVGLCEGEILDVHRIWADGKLLDLSQYTYRIYKGTETQNPDSCMEQKDGEGNIPGYRGLAYVVFEDMQVNKFGNRIPQMTFEVTRRVTRSDDDAVGDLVTGICLIPGTTEFGYDPNVIIQKYEDGSTNVENDHLGDGNSDWKHAIDQMEANLPNVNTVCFVVSWFGDDLRIGNCTLRPKVENQTKRTDPISWRVAGLTRDTALVISQVNGRPAYGGTPNDLSVYRAIQDLKNRGYEVMFYPFIVMDIPSGNTLPNPYSDNASETGQPIYPWRGRITCSPAAGYAGTVDKTATAADQVAAFFGSAQPGDFAVTSGPVGEQFAGVSATAAAPDEDHAAINWPTSVFGGGAPAAQTGQTWSFTLVDSSTQDVTIAMVLRDAESGTESWMVTPRSTAWPAQTVTALRIDPPAEAADATVTFTGAADDWGLRRMVLHYANLCAAAGGVDAFLIGSEMRGLTTIRSGASSYPAVQAFRDLAADVRSILGVGTAISYAADWSEYFGHQPGDGSGDVFFHLDPLWADSNIDFIGIDNYMKLSDWRDGDNHADYGDGVDAYGNPKGDSIYDLEYLKGQVAGGEDYDYFYASTADRVSQTRTAIDDAVDLSSGLTETYSYSVGVIPGGDMVKTQGAVFIGSFVLPSSPTDGYVFEHGGPGIGCFVGVRGSGTTFRLRAGDGASSKSGSTTDTVVLDIPVSELPFDGEIHEVAWEFRPTSGRIRLWVDRIFRGEAFTSGGGNMERNSWSGGGNGGYLSGSAGNIPVGEPTSPWPDTSGASNLLVYDGNQLIANEPSKEDWVFRQKDIVNWWSNSHKNRPGGVRGSTATSWTPESKPIIMTEFGCPAINKGTNQPNVFYDPKSSESFVPYFSSGGRDDEIQRQYIRAFMEYWKDNSNNPASGVYSGRMIDTSRMHYWSYDARPWPTFPTDGDAWADQENWQYGHWISGRIDTVYLPDLLNQLAEDYNVTADYDFSQAYGSCDGFVVQAKTSFRSTVEPLASLFMFDIIESGATIKAVSQQESRSIATVTLDDIAEAQSENDEPVVLTRSQASELPVGMTIKYIDVFKDYEMAAVSQRREITESESEPSSDTPIVIDYARAQQMIDRLLYSAWSKRTVGEFGLLPEFLYLEAGDVVTVNDGNFNKPLRIEGIADSGYRQITARSFDLGIFQPGGGASRTQAINNQPVAIAPTAVFMDLPMLRSVDVPYCPYAAAYVTPWPGVNVYRSITDSNYGLDTTLIAPSIIGRTTDPFDSGVTDVWDLTNELKVEIFSEELSTLPEENVLNGGNALAIENSNGGWEIVQFVNAQLTGTRTYTLTKLLRGQFGTEDQMEDALPAGARIVLIESTLQQLSLGINDINREYYLKYGPANRDIGNDLYQTVQRTFTGRGLRPYSPVHIAGVDDGAGNITLSWVRRTRINGDSWDYIDDVPLNEAYERYEVDILDGSDNVVRTLTVTDATSVVYTAAQQSTDGISAPFDIIVYQLSDQVGRGIGRRATIHG